MKPIEFAKMAATGNDFILFDNRETLFRGDEKDYFRKICQRRFSVGADGVILIEKSSSADFQYRHFNSDGYPVTICGNGARAACWYAFLKKITGNSITFEAGGSIYHGRCSENQVTVDHPEPLDIQTKLGVIRENFFEEGGFLKVGVPHLVIFTSDTAKIDVFKWGRKFRYHPLFDKGTNVNFVQVIDTQILRIRTYERGVEGETFACGTGAMASALISHIKKGIKNPVEVKTKGGTLGVNWDKGFSRLYLSGQARLIFEGKFIEK